MSQMFEFNGVQLELRMTDADFLDRYEAAFKRMGQQENDLIKVADTGSGAAYIRQYCKIFFDLYDELFGAGTSEKMFQGRCDSIEVDESYAAFLTAARSARADAENARNKWKYGVNREQRRNGKKKRYRQS